MSEACRFDQNISKGGDGKKVMIFSDSRTNPSEEGEDDKNHGVPKDSKNYVNNKIRTCAQRAQLITTTKFEPAHRELN